MKRWWRGRGQRGQNVAPKLEFKSQSRLVVVSPNQRRPLPLFSSTTPATMQGLHSRWRGISLLVEVVGNFGNPFFPAVELVVAGSITGSWVDAMQMRPRCTFALNHLHSPNPRLHFFFLFYFVVGIVLFFPAVSQGSARLQTGFSSLMMMPAQTWRQPLHRPPPPTKQTRLPPGASWTKNLQHEETR